MSLSPVRTYSRRQAEARRLTEQPAGETCQVPGAVRVAPPRQRGRTVPGRQRPVSHGVSGSAHLARRGTISLIVPRGVEHRPVAEEEAHVPLFEPASTLNTGNVQNERTVANLERIDRGD